MGYIGIDIGGTNVRYSITDELIFDSLKCNKKSFIKTGNPYTEVEKNICSIIDNYQGDLDGIGISLAAVMERNTGIVKVWPNNPCWNHYNLVKHLNYRYHVPIIIEDDANCGALFEYHSLSESVQNMAYITIGTGIGCGLILSGSLFIGENGFAGEIGHICVDGETTKSVCSCGNKGCFQALASGPATLKEYNKSAKKELYSMEQVYEEYIQNDLNAVKCFSNMINITAMVIYNLVMCLDIPIVIIGGGVSNIGHDLVLNIQNKVNNRLKTFERKVIIRQALLEEFSGVYGALLLLKNHNR